MTDEIQYVTDMVLPGENLRLFAERHGVEYRRIMELNDRQLADDARARGFDAHTFLRPVPDDEGGAVHEGRIRVRHEPDAHVFPGQILRVKPRDEEQAPPAEEPKKSRSGVTQTGGTPS